MRSLDIVLFSKFRARCLRLLSCRLTKGLAIGAAAFLCTLIFSLFDFSEKLELITLDIRYRLRPEIKKSDDIVLINFDDPSIEHYGHWPWSRIYQTILVETLSRYKTGYIGFDVFFSEEESPFILKRGTGDNTSSSAISIVKPDIEFAEAIRKAKKVYLAYSSRDPSVEASRAEVEKETEVIRQSFSDSKKRAVSYMESSLQESPPHITPFVYKSIDIEPPLIDLLYSARGFGFAQPGYSRDSIARNFILYRYYNGRLLYPITLVMLSDIKGLDLRGGEIRPGKEIVFRSPDGILSIPVDRHLQTLLNWPGEFERSFTHVSFMDIVRIYAYHKAHEIALRAPKSTTKAIVSSVIDELSIYNLLPSDEIRAIAVDAAAMALIHNALQRGDGQERIEKSLMWLVGPKEIAEKIRAISDAGGRPPPPKIRVKKNGEDYLMSPLELKDKIVFVGLTGKGTIDLNPTPFEKSCPMVFYHASAMNMLLNGSFLHYPKEALRYLIPLVIALCIGLVGVYRSAAILTVLTMLIGFGILFASYSFWVDKGQWIEIILPMTALLLAYMFSVILQFIKVYGEKARIRAIFSAMVSPAVLSLMEKNPDRFSLTGERRHATTYFSKIDGIDSLLKSLSPEEMPVFLSSYLTPLSNVILQYGGYIDKYEGAVIMADFGVPLEDRGNTYKCAYAALEQTHFVDAFKESLRGKYEIDAMVSIGFNAGYVSAGNMGSDRKFQYTVMGDAVNMAARFMAANSIYQSRFPITSEETVSLLKDYVYARPLDKLLLKGKTIPTKVYDIIGWKAEAYREVMGELKRIKTLPTFLWSFWATSPAGCVLYYADYWRRQHRRLDHPLAERLASFFGAHTGLARERIIVGFLSEALKAAEVLITLSKEAQHSLMIPDLANDLEAFLHACKDSVDVMLGDTGLVLLPAVETLGNKIRMLSEGFCRYDDSIEGFRGTLKAYAKHPADQLKGLLEKLELSYQDSVNGLLSSIKAEEYYDLLSKAGEPEHRETITLFEEGLELYWQRQWDDAIEVFQRASAISGDDRPTLLMIERIRDLKLNPPKEGWLGEFIQTKK